MVDGPEAEALAALAFVARRSGTRAMPRSRWALVMAFELGWMNPGQARAYVEAALASGLLESDGGGGEGEPVRLRIDPAQVEVPRGFRPNPASLPAPRPQPAAGRPPPAAGEAGPRDAFPAWLEACAAAQRAPRQAVLAQVAALQDELGGLLDADVAVLWVAHRAGLPAAAAARETLRAGRLAPPVIPNPGG